MLAENCGAARFLAKPADPEVILAIVDEVLGSKAPEVTPLPSDFEQTHLTLLTDELAAKVRDLEFATQRLDSLVQLNLELASAKTPNALLATLGREARTLIASRYAFVGVLEEGSKDRLRIRIGETVSRRTSRATPRRRSLSAAFSAASFASNGRYGYRATASARSRSGCPRWSRRRDPCWRRRSAARRAPTGWLCLTDRLGGRFVHGRRRGDCSLARLRRGCRL